ncbi:hypothetical protein HG536_0A04690 [Torulaspora globosa]|uniref:Uncharacterized protein n=1 Tax=Torulaspora globosa TaxID=48254 RepID=A0A7G3ZAW7_9SACH|nr:uncharacterized protein HG536_0A04690 [Torulaspora globosa]QLL30653.1 hypothetical protein HG536_0A04690 [Torulaspora globosa]
MSNNSSTFHELRPICIDISRLAFQPKEVFNPQSVPLRDALAKLEAKLASYEDASIQANLADYIFIPISSLLKQESLGEAQSSYVLLIISHLLRVSWRRDGILAEELAQQLLPLLPFLISRDPTNDKLEKISQDCKRAGCCALYEYSKSLAQQSYSPQFFSSKNSKNLRALAHGISVLLTILEQSSKDWQTQLMILDTLRILYCDIVRDGEVLSFILPGNISSFARILMLPGLTTNYKVVIKSLDVMKHLILLVYDDLSLNVHDNRLRDIKELRSLDDLHEEALSMEAVLIEKPDKDGQSTHRSTAWLRATSSQLRMALERIIPKLQKRSNIEISKALVDLASDLLSRCAKSLHNCERCLVEVLLRCKMDPKLQLLPHTACLRELLRDELASINTKIQFQDVDAIRSLNYGLKYFTEISATDDTMLVSDLYKSALTSIESGVETATFNKVGRAVLEQSSNVVMADFSDELVNSKNLPAIFPSLSKELEEALSQLFMTTGRLASKNGQLKSIIESLLSDQVGQSTITKAIALWLSSQIMLTVQEDCSAPEYALLNLDSAELDKQPCYDILEFGKDLAQEIVTCAEGKKLSRLSEISLVVIVNSIETVCRVLGREFSSELVDYLYIIVENLASSSPTVRHFAQSCSLTIAHVLYNNSVQDMILQNVDYLADSIASRLNCGLTERVSTVFMVVSKLAGYETIECFRDIIETFFKFLDYYHGYDSMCLEFFQLFEVIALEIQKRYFTADAGNHHIAYHSDRHCIGSPWGMSNLQQVLAIMDKQSPAQEHDSMSILEKDPKSFQEYFDSKLRVADSDDEDDDDSDQELDEDPTELSTGKQGANDENRWVSPVPRESYRILLQILGYGDRLLTHRSKPLKIQILKVINLVIPMLASQYNSFLPQVAQIWETLVLCSLNDDLSIVKPACDCLRELIRNAGDFITTRFLELWKTWQEKSPLLRELAVSNANSNIAIKSITLHRKFPTITQTALTSQTQVLMEGMMVAGLTIPDLTSREMIYCCIQVHGWKSVAARSLAIADTIHAILQETH